MNMKEYLYMCTCVVVLLIGKNFLCNFVFPFLNRLSIWLILKLGLICKAVVCFIHVGAPFDKNPSTLSS